MWVKDSYEFNKDYDKMKHKSTNSRVFLWTLININKYSYIWKDQPYITCSSITLCLFRHVAFMHGGYIKINTRTYRGTIRYNDGALPIWDGRRQTIIGTNAGMLLVRPLKPKFSEILIEIYMFSFTKMHLKLSGNWRPFCLSFNMRKFRKKYHLSLSGVL